MFDPKRPYRRAPQVALRPEPFGALVYDFTTRRLSFLKTKQLAEVVASLENHADVDSTLDDVGVVAGQRAAYLHALAGLADAGTIQPREL
ncbi:mycofactocin biosynthesis chaperone MftB [Kutzneria kofuensis]|jgi:putative mycofactocin binding protein MftB|uniref:Putative mycofactocin binding protein MftB n=1 Tax=Kutzneria kofuensis TaxID=103725 RepID=A0A7W9KNK1_9PSEU|nr:mycofactocin biosynthesis chaperone MftB [Kutzneria kofuensis]MBB5895114.1 putative mycofactocin binding protein MftB [Kutzneria kofuensis]